MNTPRAHEWVDLMLEIRARLKADDEPGAWAVLAAAARADIAYADRHRKAFDALTAAELIVYAKWCRSTGCTCTCHD